MAKQVEKVERISRAQAANQVVAAVNGKTTLSALATKADKLFVDAGGESKPKAAVAAVRRALATAEAVGVLQLTKPTDVMVERVKK